MVEGVRKLQHLRSTIEARSLASSVPFTLHWNKPYKADSHRPKQNRRTGLDLFAKIKADGYTGGYSQLTAFIRNWRDGEGKKPHAFVPLKFELGEAFQFDWSEEGFSDWRHLRRMQVSHLKLCASRAFWLVAYPSQGHENAFDAHTRSSLRWRHSPAMVSTTT